MSTIYYESSGDYQMDAKNFDESASKPLYQYQSSLPTLPVPSLAQTVERLKPTALTLTEFQVERDAFEEACQAFPAQARSLQQDLEKRAAESPDNNWLQSWWNQVGYLQPRDPIPINVSYFFQLDKVSNRTQLQRGAAVLKAVHEYSRLVLGGTLPQETIGRKQTTPLCSAFFRYMFYACRIPHIKQDTYRVHNVSPLQQHAVVAVNGHYFTLQLVNPDTNEPYSVAELEAALQDCVVSSTCSPEGVGLGVLTTADRDEWARNRAQLLMMGGMPEAMEKLQSSLVVLCLDDKPTYSYSQSARQYLCGIQNRWYDKSLQFILSKNANLGLNGEHSMMDGMPVVGLCNYILKQERQTPAEGTGTLNKCRPQVENIFQTVLQQLSADDHTTVQSMVQNARSDFEKRNDSLGLHCLSFCGYGNRWIKSRAGCSPDAFVQMAIQLAVSKLFGGAPQATYESTQVRSFLYGRTETTRSVSPQSVAWTQAMADCELSASKKLEMLRSATEAHTAYIRSAATGQGVDRHCFGLTMVATETGEAIPDLLKDPLFLKSKRWVVSTSTLPGVNPGFGPVVQEGLGIAYDIRERQIYLTASAYKGYKDAESVKYYLEESLLEMKDLVEMNTEENKSKL